MTDPTTPNSIPPEPSADGPESVKPESATDETGLPDAEAGEPELTAAESDGQGSRQFRSHFTRVITRSDGPGAIAALAAQFGRFCAGIVSAIRTACVFVWNWFRGIEWRQLCDGAWSRLRGWGSSAIGGLGRLAARLQPSRAVVLSTLGVLLLTTSVVVVYRYFLFNVPSGHMLVTVSMFGEPLKEGQILAGPGQKGVREQVLGEGWHFVWPILFETELKKNSVVPGQQNVEGEIEPAKVGIVKALGGEPLPPGVFLADRGQQGIWREVLLPGSYRLNPYGFEVKLVDMVEIKPGNVGVLRRKLGSDGPTEFASGPNEKGILRDKVLEPGLYPINTEEYEVISCPIGIYQTTYHYDLDKSKNTSLVFDSRDSFRIELDCTIEWELQPEYWPEWVAKFRKQERIESAVIKLNVKNISRNEGQNYGAEDFLQGDKREEFQTEFTNRLSEECERDHVVVRHAFIRNIIIRDEFLRPKREEQLAKEKAETQKELKITAVTDNEVVAAEQTIDLEVQKVEAETEQMVALIERDVSNLKLTTDAELEKMKDTFAAEIAILESQRTELIGTAEAEAKKTVDTAKSALHKMQMDVFANDAQAFFRYSMSQNLNPALRIRLFQSGPGTFWTNMGEKNLNLFAPVPGGSSRKR